MSATLILDLPQLETVRPETGALHRALAQAPLGAYPLLEAAFGWQELRPSGWHRPPAAGTAIALSPSSAAAARLASLLSTLTWANVVETGAGEWRVEVSAAAYNRIVRALTGAWRSRTQLLAGGPATAEARQAALGVWRMAMLTGGLDVHAGTLTVRAGTLPAAQLLVAGAARLGLPAATDGPRVGGFPVRVTGRVQVHQLLAEATGQR